MQRRITPIGGRFALSLRAGYLDLAALVPELVARGEEAVGEFPYLGLGGAYRNLGYGVIFLYFQRLKRVWIGPSGEELRNVRAQFGRVFDELVPGDGYDEVIIFFYSCLIPL